MLPSLRHTLPVTTLLLLPLYYATPLGTYHCLFAIAAAARGAFITPLPISLFTPHYCHAIADADAAAITLSLLRHCYAFC